VNAITVANLAKRYGGTSVVDDVSFEVPSGQLVAVLGPNGAGKTTTIEMLEGFVEPTAGTLRVLGSDPRRASRAWRARIGLVLQSTSLDSEPTVRDLLGLFAGLYPNPRPVDELLDLVDLRPEATARICDLSGGQQRRVDIGVALAGRPELLFLDEPTTGLDPEARRRCWATIEDVTAAGTTVLLTTHYLDEADHLADRVLVLTAGRLAADTSPDALRRRTGASTIRYRIPADARPDARADARLDDLPAVLAEHVTDGLLVMQCTDVAAALGALVCWARRHRLDLTGLDVGPPSLEDAYLAVLSTRS
jgi:ABC-2 type transport system ATP-binding protein